MTIITEDGVVLFAPQASLVWVDATGASNDFIFDNVLSEEWTCAATVTEHPVEQGANVADHVRVELTRVTLTVHATNEPLTSNNFADAVVAPLPVHVPGPRWINPPVTPILYDTWSNLIGLRADLASVVGALGGNKAIQASQDAIELASVVTGAFGKTLPIFDGINVPNVALAPVGLPAPTPTGDVMATTQQWPGGGLDFVEETIAELLALKDQAQLFTVNGSKQAATNMVIETLAYSRAAEDGSGTTITIAFREIRIVSTQTVDAPLPAPALTRATPPSDKGEQNPDDAAPQVQSAFLSLAQYLTGLH